MRIATWNVNSLKARLEKLAWWVGRTAPDVLLLQETKLADADVPREAMARLGYEVAHCGEGRWNGVAIASRIGLDDVVRPEQKEARFLAARCGGLRVVNVYAPNGRVVGSESYVAKLAWYADLAAWLRTTSPDEPLVLGGDMNVAPDDRDVWDPALAHGGTHVSEPEREAFRALLAWGLVDAFRAKHDEAGRYTWWDYRAGDFFKNYGMRIDHLLVTKPLATRIVLAEIDREARKGKPTPSDHAPLVVDVDELGRPFDAGWAGAEARIAARREAKRKT